MVRILRLSEMTSEELASIKRRAELDIEQALTVAREVITEIRTQGDSGLINYVRKFDYSEATIENLKVSPAEFAAAQQQVEPEIKEALQQAYQNIREVHQRQMPEEIQLAEIDQGVFAGEKVTPIASAGYMCLGVRDLSPL